MSDNYYNEILDTIDDCLKLGNYEHGLQIIEQELQMPYVPLKFNDELLKRKTAFLQHLDSEKRVVIYDNNAFINAFYDGSLNYLVILQSLSKYNIRNYLNEINVLLQDEKILRTIKSCLIFELVKQKVDEQFSLQDNGRTISFNPINLTEPFLQENFIKALKLLDKYLFKNPSLNEICKTRLREYVINIFPEYISEERIDIIIFSIIRSIYESFGQNDQWKQFAEELDIDENVLEDNEFW